MSLTKLLHPTNRRVRLLVGLFLAGLFCIQCTQSDASRRSSDFLLAIGGQTIGANSPAVNEEVLRLAKTDHVALLEYCLAHYDRSYRDYTATFIKQERIGGRMGTEQWINVSFMDEPFSVAMAWTKNAPVGDRVLYVDGKYNGRMLVRPANGLLRALAPTVARQVNGPEAMRNSLRPVTMFGFKNVLGRLVDTYKLARQRGESVEQFVGFVEVMGRPTLVLQRVLPSRPDYPVHRSVVYIDAEYLVPICVEGYDWNEQAEDWDKRLVCRYVFTDLKFNVGLAEGDFAPAKLGLQTPK